SSTAHTSSLPFHTPELLRPTGGRGCRHTPQAFDPSAHQLQGLHTSSRCFLEWRKQVHIHLHSRCTHHIPQRSSFCHRTTAPEERLCCNIHQSYLRHHLPFFLLNTHCLRHTSRVASGISHSRAQARS